MDWIFPAQYLKLVGRPGAGPSLSNLQPCIMQTISLWQVGVLIYAMGGQ